MDEASQRLIGDLLHQLRPGEQAGFVLEAPGPALALPVELIRLTTSAGTEAGPLALLPAVSVSRRLAARPGAEAAVRPQVVTHDPGLALPGPLVRKWDLSGACGSARRRVSAGGFGGT